MPQVFIRNRTTWLAYLMLATYSFFLNIFGPIIPFLKDELNLSYTASGLHSSAFALGIIGIGLFGHHVIQRIGRWNSLWFGAFGMGLSGLLLIAGRTPILTIGASFLMGLVGSLILAIIPSVLSDQYGEMRAVALSEANVIASVFSAIAPVLVGWFALSVWGWRTALIVAAVFILVMRFGFRNASLPPIHVTTEADQTQRLPLLYWIYWIALVVVVSIEFCMIFWSASYLEIGLGIAKAEAAQAVSLFLAGMIIGRLVSSRLVQQFRTHQVVMGSLLITSGGFLIYWTVTVPLLGLLGLFITGLGVSSLYPLILSLAIGSAKGNTVRASALSSLASGVAIFTLPLILGRLADGMGLHAAYVVIVPLLVIVFVIIQSTGRISLPDGSPEQTSP